MTENPWQKPSAELPREKQPLELYPSEREALSFLLPLSPDYPTIEQWFRVKVVPGLRDGTRHVLSLQRDGNLVGLGIAKSEPHERKICTVRVAPAYVGRGIGVRLFDGLLRWLNDDQPHLTVSAARFPQFERIFEYYKFRKSWAKSGLYVPTEMELGFNEHFSAPQVGADAFTDPRSVPLL